MSLITHGNLFTTGIFSVLSYLRLPEITLSTYARVKDWVGAQYFLVTQDFPLVLILTVTVYILQFQNFLELSPKWKKTINFKHLNGGFLRETALQ